MISQHAIVLTKTLGANVTVAEFAVIREGVSIGNNVRIHPHVVINTNVAIGDNVEIFPGAVIGKGPANPAALSRQPVWREHTIIGSGSSIGPHAIIYYDVQIGANTLIGDGASVREQSRIGSYCVVSRYVTLNYNVIIGDRTKILDFSHITGNTIIGNDVFISFSVTTTNDNALGSEPYSESMRGPVIMDKARIGAGAILLPGVVVESDSIIAAGAVVTRNVKSGTMAVGIPARPLRGPER